MAAVLAGTGLFVHLRLGEELDRSIDQGLRSRADQISALIRHSDSSKLGGSGGTRLSEREERFAQILDSRGRLIDSSSQIVDAPILTPSEHIRARSGTFITDH